ncbi:MAG: signal peptide peptidase SppA [bacterium]
MKKRRIFIAFIVILALVIITSILSSVLNLGIEKPVIGDRVGVVEITGIIKGSDEILKQLSEFNNDKNVKAIILRIDSPGGAVGPSQEIYSEVMKIRKKKPVVASIGTLGASGGYYIAAGANKIVANPGTITGSIGVIIQFYNFYQLLNRFGIKGNTVKSGEFKDTGSPLREMTKDERAYIQSVIDDVHNQFVEAVANGRNLKKESIIPVADGRIITGKMAKELKLVDEIGNFNDAVNLAKKLAGLEGEPKLVYAKKKRNSLLDLISGFSENDSKSKILMLLSELRLPYYLTPLIEMGIVENE